MQGEENEKRGKENTKRKGEGERERNEERETGMKRVGVGEGDLLGPGKPEGRGRKDNLRLSWEAHKGEGKKGRLHHYWDGDARHCRKRPVASTYSSTATRALGSPRVEWRDSGPPIACQRAWHGVTKCRHVRMKWAMVSGTLQAR